MQRTEVNNHVVEYEPSMRLSQPDTWRRIDLAAVVGPLRASNPSRPGLAD